MDKKDLPPYLRKEIGHSLSSIWQAKNEQLKSRWTVEWAKSPRFNHSRFDDLLTLHSQKFLKYISSRNISRTTASKIFRLRVGHTPLNKYLHRFKKVDSLQCPACRHLKEMPDVTFNQYWTSLPTQLHRTASFFISPFLSLKQDTCTI